MYESSEEPGRKFQNIQHGKTFDRVRKEEKSSKKSKPKEKSTDESEHEKPMHEVVAEHGPVHMMEMHSHHEDGHVHKAQHHDAGAMHNHVDEAMGMEHAEPDGDEGMPMASAGGMPPGM